MDKAMQKAKRELVRWRILGALYQDRANSVSDDLLQAVMRSRLSATTEEIRNELAYLEQRRLVKILVRQEDYWQVDLTWIGWDLVEHTIKCEPGIARPASANPSTKQIKTYMLRGRILHVVSINTGVPTWESLLLGCISGPDFPTTMAELRMELNYMAKRGLIELGKENAGNWQAGLTREGTDVLQETVPLFPGIMLRPDCNARL